jgi:putative FmdB family regulatory protein
MPTYEYMCQACGHQWEAVQRMKDDPLKDCPICDKPKAKRQISAGAGFILKGGGWYSDLYASAKAKGAEAPVAKPKGSSDEKSSKKTDAKSDKAATPASDTSSGKKEPSSAGTAGASSSSD